MIKITKEQLTKLSPNLTAVSNGKKISDKGGFVSLYKTEDESMIFGECSGSGKSNYRTSVDFIDESNPVFRCSCPSRQFPCKHGIAIIFDWLAKKDFKIAEIPEDILQKHNKQAAKKEKQAEKSVETATVTKPKKTNTSAAKKKAQKQLEGLQVAEKFVNDVMRQGISALSGASLSVYSDLVKEMGNYYLSGIQSIIVEINYLAQKLSDNNENIDEVLNQIRETLFKLHATIIRCKDYLNDKIENNNFEPSLDVMYEKLGNVWKLELLKQLGSIKKNARVLQLNFNVEFLEAQKTYLDIGYFVDLDNGEISKTVNIVPVKSIKFIKRDDSTFSVINIPEMCYYPGEINKRIRWDSFTVSEPTKEDYCKVRSFARDNLAECIKIVKNQFKNILSDKTVVMLVKYDMIGKTSDNKIVLKQGDETIELLARINCDNSVETLLLLDNSKWKNNGVITLEFWLDTAQNKIYAMPLSIVTENQIIRLFY